LLTFNCSDGLGFLAIVKARTRYKVY